MTITYALGPIPRWFFTDQTGEPLAAGKMYSYRNLNKTEAKPIYQDSSGANAWTNPVLFDLNGMQGPFYFKVDSNLPSDTYYLRIYDRDDNFQFDVENYSPGSGGGGGTVTTYVELDNYLVNNQFWRNIGISTTPLPIDLVIAPGANVGFSTPNIHFIKNNTNANDTISFETFLLGDDPLTGDVTPNQFPRYTCTNSPTSETYKFIQFPIDLKVSNLDDQTMRLSVWARGVSGSVTTLDVWLLQFFGNGGTPSPSVRTSIQTLSLTSSWQQFFVDVVFPTTAGKVLGACGDDATYIQFEYPLGSACVIDFVKPCLFLGQNAPTATFETYDSIESVIDKAQTGDVRISINNYYPGWVSMNDGTIGSAASGATTRANIDTFQLFSLLWNQVGATYAPLFSSAGSPVSYGVSAIADFTANCRISLTKQLGRDLASVGIPSSGGTGTNWALGQTDGAETHALTIPQLAAHTHNIVGAYTTIAESGDVSIYTSSGGTVSGTTSTGSGTPFNIVDPRTHYNIYMKL